MSDHLQCAKSQIKLIIRDLEREIGVTESAPINLHLAGALDAIAAAEREAARRRA
jgi:citrate lyase gamma subunit